MTNLSTKCTFYKNVKDHQYKGGPLTTPGRLVAIQDLLKNERYTNGSLLNKLRLSPYKSDFYNNEKSNLSAACFSSVQDNLSVDRSDINHLFHTGFITIDIDPEDNPYLFTDGEGIRDFIIEKIPYISYLGRSVSNLGYWGLIPVLNKDDHYGHYEAVKELFKSHQIKLDSLKDISRLRFLAYDPDGFINDNAKVFAESKITETTITVQDEYERTPTDELFIAACQWVEAKYEIKFQPGCRHNYLLRLYSTLRGCYISRPHILNWVYNNLIDESQINSNCLEEPKWKK